jgi:hypothetical protein
MPRLDTETHTFSGNFSFSGTRITNLGATEYTLVDIEVDMSSSVSSFLTDLKTALRTAVEACRKSPRSENLLIRVAAFSDRYQGGVSEIHGFLPLHDIDPTIYDTLRAGGNTPLRDACYTGSGAMHTYAQGLSDHDFIANGISFTITDGVDNASVASSDMLKVQLVTMQTDEVLESHLSILIGINATHCASDLADFQSGAGITQFVDAGDATPGRLAKLAQFVSQSISSTSQALGTGGPSQTISPTI